MAALKTTVKHGHLFPSFNLSTDFQMTNIKHCMQFKFDTRNTKKVNFISNNLNAMLNLTNNVPEQRAG